MAKMKNDINFIESQKLAAKQNQSASFEFILVISVILLVFAMAFIYMMYYFEINGNVLIGTPGLKDNIATEEKRLNEDDGKSSDYDNKVMGIYDRTTDNMKKFNECEIATNADGEPIIKGTDGAGNLIYEYKSYGAVEAETKAQLEAAAKAKIEVGEKIDFTSIILNIVYAEATAQNCTVTSIEYNGGSVILSLTSPTNEEWGKYSRALCAKENTASGLDNTQYIADVKSAATTQTGGVYTFRITFTVKSDKSLFVSDEKGGNE